MSNPIRCIELTYISSSLDISYEIVPKGLSIMYISMHKYIKYLCYPMLPTSPGPTLEQPKHHLLQDLFQEESSRYSAADMCRKVRKPHT